MYHIINTTQKYNTTGQIYQVVYQWMLGGLSMNACVCLYADIWSKRATQFVHLQKSIAQKPSHTPRYRGHWQWRNKETERWLQLGPSVGSADLLSPLKRKITENEEKEVKFDTVIVWIENKKNWTISAFIIIFLLDRENFVLLFLFLFIPLDSTFFENFP